MKYLFLAYGDEQLLATMSAGEHEALEQACRDNDEALRASGHLLRADGLHGSQSATTVRVRQGRLALSDGPPIDSHEQLSGLFLIDARDLNEAIQVAARMPQARAGPIEVRPLREPQAAHSDPASAAPSTAGTQPQG